MMASVSFRPTTRIIAITALAISTSAQAAPPENDTCSGAIVLTLPPGTPVAFDVPGNEATADPIDMGTCNSTTNATAGVWWRFDATIAGAIRLIETSQNDVAIGIWVMDTVDAMCPNTGPATHICRNDEAFSFGVQPNKSYYILMQNRTATEPVAPYSGTFTFFLVPNDDCINATVVNLILDVPVSVAAEIPGATLDQINVGTCNGLLDAPYGVWWRIDSNVRGAVQFKTGSTLAFGIWEMDSVTAECPATGPAIICRQGNEVFFDVSVNKSYFILVHPPTSSIPLFGISGTFTFRLPPSNDTCDGAININSELAKNGPFTILEYNGGATNDAEAGVSCNSSGVWFKYVVPEQGAYLYVAEIGPQSSRTGRFYGSSGACPPNVPVLCTDMVSEVWIAAQTHALGLTHMYCVGLNGTQQSGLNHPLQLTFAEFPPNTNEDCASARVITGPGTFTVNSIGMADATDNSPILCDDFSTEMDHDSWFSWVATSDGMIAIAPRSLPSPANGQFAVYAGGPSPGVCPTGGAGLIDCGTVCSVGVCHPIAAIPVVSGNVYYFQFAKTSGTGTDSMFVNFDFSPSSLGACCVGSACSIMTPGECAATSGSYAGDSTSCSSATGVVSEYTKSASPFTTISSNSIEPNGVGMWQSTIEITDDFPINDVEVDFVFGHTQNGDLLITLENDTHRVVLHSRGRIAADHTLGIGSDFLNTNSYTWSDEGVSSIFDVTFNPAGSIPSGVYKPSGVWGLTRGMKGTFNGIASRGKWRLTVQDFPSSSSGTGAAVSWTLRLKHGTLPSCATPCACLGDMNGSSSRGGDDLQSFVNCMTGGGGGCGCADVDGIPGLTSADTEVFVNLLLNSPACP